MLLKSLELQGFKSFPDKTRLEFHNGLTAVVGPNGSGKSNISDAVRWVLGEQSSRALRGSRMEDVIFVGTKNRRSQGFAQVSLTFDNSDRTLKFEGDNVVITRKYYRSGESEYLLNGKQALLKDISELLMDTGLSREGYSMIGQGRIEEIVSAKSSDRRQIFEEAAGITKLRYRKREALKELKLAEENCVRLDDILRELEDRVEPLKKQAEKAIEYRALDERRTSLQISLWVEEISDFKEQLRKLQDELELANRDYMLQEEKMTALAEETKRLYQQVQKAQGTILQIRGEKEELFKKRAQAQTDIAVLSESISQGERNLNRLEAEKDLYSSSERQLLKERDQRKKELEDLKNKRNDIERTINEKSGDIASLIKDRDGFSSKLLAVQEKEKGLELSRSNVSFNVSALENRICEGADQNRELYEKKDEREALLEELNGNLSDAKDLIKAIDAQLEELSNRRVGYSAKRDARLSKKEEFEEKFQKLELAIREREQRRGILEELEHNMEGFSYSVRFLKGESQKGALTGICGTVAECITVGERETAAIETALGGALQHIITVDENAAKRAINRLKERNAGRATFLPITSVKGKCLQQPGLLSEDGIVGIASDLVEFDERYRPIIEQLLGRTVVAVDLDVAVDVAKRYGYKFRIVTLDGQLVQAGGSLTGGSRAKSGGVLSRKNEILKIEQDLALLEDKRKSAASQRVKLTEQVEEITAELQNLDGSATVCREDKIRAQGEVKRIEGQILSLEEEQKCFLDKVAGFEKQKAAAEKELVLQKEKLDELNAELDILNKEKNSITKQRQQIELLISEKEKEMQSLNPEYSSISEELARKEAFLQSVLQRLDEGKGRFDNLILEIEHAKTSLKEQAEEKERLKNSSELDVDIEKELDEKIQLWIAKQNEAEGSIQERRLTERDLQDEKEKLGLQAARLEERKKILVRDEEQIISSLWEQYQCTESDARERAVVLNDISEAKRELSSLKGKIRALGSVNLEAVEEYQEVSKRYEFLKAEMKDVQTSKRELEKMIQGLTSNMESIFTEAFTQINSHFSEVFTELFGGGSAELKLDDPENVLDSGIEIKVQPPGKIIKNISSLSGGEKSFVAIAIYFAILKVRPAPFCILDEIEAALDDVNVDRFAAYLKKMDENTQFIVITHRRGTMEQADMLYGVTMQEEGVSKLLQLERADVRSVS